MRTALGILLSLVVIVTMAPPSTAREEGPVVADRVVVQMSDGTWESRLLAGPNRDVASLIANDAEIEGPAPQRVYRQYASATPDDPSFGLQWHLRRNQAPRAWQHGDGAGVTVAILDSGVDQVTDLDCHEFVSPADFVFGQVGVPDDLNGHGTLVAQVIVECTDNSIAGAGVSPGASLMPIRVMDGSGSTTSYEVFDGLFWALDHGADVVNLSFGFPCATGYPACSDPIIDYAISRLIDAGIVVVAASGNDGGTLLSYPANHPSVIAVGASGFDGQIAAYSTGGSGIDLVAPTGDTSDPADNSGVVHQGASGLLELGTGTSYSAPQVSGAYAILLSEGASPAQATAALLGSAADIAPRGYDRSTGHGELRIREALAWGGAGLTPPIADAALHHVGDANGDGRSDAVTYDARFGRWWVLASTGNEFIPGQWARYSSASGWSAQLAGDFSGDDKLDLASFHPSNGTWWVSPSTGSSFATRLWADFSTASGWGPHLVGDFDGDGRDDIANYHSSNGTWWVSESTGASFTTSRWADFSTAKGWKLHLVGDFDGDGRDDIASYHPSNGTWWISRSTGTRFTTELWADFSTASGWSAHKVGDFDGNGRDDIANFHPSNGTWWVSRSTGNRFATSLWADFTAASGWGPQLVGDFDGNGRDDLANYARSNGTWWVSKSTGSAFATALWADYSTSTGYTAQLVGDFDGDGRDDIANHHATGSWVVSRSRTQGGFATSTWFD